MERLPYISKDKNGIWTLYVHEKPYLMLAGEIHNSSSSSLEYMKKEVWEKIRGLHLNTLIVPITWETVEPEEGKFDFSLAEGIIRQARDEGMYLVLLWFGLWKNGESTYVPDWVKIDTKRFQRACYPGKILSDTITPLCKEAVEADAKAFCKLMKFLREFDQQEQTVLMIQVENEIGFLGAERDYSALTEEEFAKPVPEKLFLLEHKKDTFGKKADIKERKLLSWKELYKEQAAEKFMAWHYACAVEKIASEGKKEYPLPMYVNAWLNQFPDRPGNYPSGGPIARNLPVWKEAAKSIDVFAPDIYVSDFDRVCKEYSDDGRALLIPEARRDTISASNVFPAFALYHTLGFSPFGIEDFLTDPESERENSGSDQQVLEKLKIDEMAFTCNGTGKYLKKSYELLESVKDLYFKYRGTDSVKGYIQKSEHERGTLLRLAGCELELTYRKHPLSEPGCAGMILEDSENSFWILGCNTEIRLLAPRGTEKHLTLLSIEQGFFENGRWHRERILNGDERYHSRLGAEPEILRFKYKAVE